MSVKLSKGDAFRHIRQLAMPAAVGLFCNTLFNITDTFYAGWLATEAQSALAFSFPLYFVQLSCCVGIMQATTARTAWAVGSGRLLRARRLAGQGLVLAGLVCVLLWLTFLPFIGELLTLLGAEGRVHEWAEDYSRIIFIGVPVFIGAFALNGILNALGNTKAFRNSIAVATVANVVLDPALMFGWWGLPQLGVKGIALATIIVQGGCALYLLWAVSHSVIARRWRWRFLLPSRQLLPGLAAHMLTPTGRMLCISAGFFIIIGFLGYFSAAAVTGYSIALRLEQLFLLPTIALESSLLAYASQSFGAGKPARVKAAYMFCLKKGWLITVTNGIIMLLACRWLVGLFNTEAMVLDYGQHYLWLAAVSGSLYVTVNVSSAVFLAGARHRVVLAVNLLRLIIVPAILFYAVAVAAGAGVTGIWVSLLFCNIGGAIFLHRSCLRQLQAERRVGQTQGGFG